jgi:hypothetical protein
MPHITIEYMIMIPIMIMQIFLFPLTATLIMNTWVDQRRTLALQDVAGHLASTMQQLYFSLNHASIPVGKASYAPGLPPMIEDYSYFANGTLRPVSGSGPNSTKIIDLVVSLSGTKNSVTTAVVLGPNLVWQPSLFLSNSTRASVTAEKTMNGTQSTITLRFDS